MKFRSFVSRVAIRAGLGAAVISSVVLVDVGLNQDWHHYKDIFREMLPKSQQEKRPRVVVLGSGWGAMSFVQRIYSDKFDVTVVSPRNHFVYTPKLTNVAVGVAEPGHIIHPFRDYCKFGDDDELRFLHAKCHHIDDKQKTVLCTLVEDEIPKNKNKKNADIVVPYDHLIIAVGNQPHMAGVSGARENAIFLHDVGDAVAIRNHVIKAMEATCTPMKTPDEISQLKQFAVVGSGPIAWKIAADMATFIPGASALGPYSKTAMVHMIQPPGEHHHPYDRHVATAIAATMKDHSNIALHHGTVESIGEKSISYVSAEDNGEIVTIPSSVVVWAAETSPKAVVRHLMASIGAIHQHSHRGLLVDSHYRVRGAKNIWAIGDCVASGLPQSAEIASRQGKYLANLFNECAEIMHQVHIRGPIPAALQDGMLNSAIEATPFFNFPGYLNMMATLTTLKPSTFDLWARLKPQHRYWFGACSSNLLSPRMRIDLLRDTFTAGAFGSKFTPIPSEITRTLPTAASPVDPPSAFNVWSRLTAGHSSHK